MPPNACSEMLGRAPAPRSPSNQSLQLTLDPVGRSATAEHPTASSAAERRRYELVQAC